MRNIGMLAAANLRKSKGQTFSVFLLIVIVSMLLNIGLVMLFGIGTFFDERAEELNSAHFYSIIPQDESVSERLDFLGGYRQVYETETTSILYANGGGFYYGSELMTGNLFFKSIAAEHQMNPPALIGESLPLTDNAIYIPHFIFLSDKFALGDDLRIEFMGTILTFTVAGSTEEMFGSNTMRRWRFYVSEQTFQEIHARFPESENTLLTARMTEGWTALRFAYSDEFDDITGTYDNFRNRIFIPTIPALIIVILALVLLTVSSIVVRFRINNDIEESMVNIGVLKAVGYSNRQIILSILTQFGLIAFIGGVIGVLPSIISLPAITRFIIEPTLGLPWSPSFNLPMTLISLASILFIVLLFAWVTSRQINKLHPIIAMRVGITTHSFKTNPIPLETSRGPHNFLLALKQLLRNKKQVVMLSIIIFGVTFSAVTTLTLHYNISVNNEVFAYTVVGDIPDIRVRLNYADDGPAFREWATARPEVNSVFGLGHTAPYIDDKIQVNMSISENFDLSGGYSLLRGRYPILDSEIALDNLTLSVVGKGIGDWVMVKSQSGGEQEYIVTGAVQGMMSQFGMINAEGARRIEPDYAFIEYGIYTTGKMAETAPFIEVIQAEKGDVILRIVTLHSFIRTVLGAMADTTAAFSLSFLLVVASVVVLVLYLVIKTIILRRKRELGIQKAVGFTTLQLMNQIALNLTPSIVFGTLAGALGGYVGFNPLFVAISRSQGIVQSNMPVPADWVITMGVALVLLSYAVSMLVSWRIRKITAYSLVSE